MNNLRRQILILHIPCGYYLPHGVTKDEAVFSIVEPELKLVEVSSQMLLADLMIGADQGALEKRPSALDGVCVDVSPYPFLGGVVDRLVRCVLVAHVPVSGPIIRIDGFCIWRNIVGHEFMQVFPRPTLALLDLDVAAALDCPDDELLIALVAMSNVLFLAAYPRFINLYDTGEQGVGRFQSLPDPVTQIPGRLVGNLESALELICAYALLGFHDHVNRQKPLPERQVGVVHDGSRRDGELIAAIVALKLIALVNAGNSCFSTTRAAYFVRPAKQLKILSAFVFAVEILNETNEVHFV